MPHRVDPKVNGAAGARICFDGSETIILDRRPILPNPANGLGGGAVNSIQIILSQRLKPDARGRRGWSVFIAHAICPGFLPRRGSRRVLIVR
jgi:hypothetical protein